MLETLTLHIVMTEGSAYTDPLTETSFEVATLSSPVQEKIGDAGIEPPDDSDEDEEDGQQLTAASVFQGEDDGSFIYTGVSKDAVEFVHVSVEAAHNAAAAAAAAANGVVTPDPIEIFSNNTGKQIPETPNEVQLVDEILAQEFNQLSVEEKDRILFEIHGLASDEDPEDLDSYYSAMERHLCEIPEKKAFEAAKYYNADFVKKNRLAFLRAERFNPKAAATLMAKHFESKQFLFGGGEILAREIRYSDLCKKTILLMESGFVQVLPRRDAAGRSILFVRPQLQSKAMQQLGPGPPSLHSEYATKAMWYMLSTTLQDEETQKKGIVAVMVGNHDCMDIDIKTMQKFHEARESLPKKIVGIHLCSDDLSITNSMAPAKLHMMTKEMRMHFRPHISKDPKQIIFELQTFGIPITEEYLKPDAQVNVTWLREWLDIRKSQEEESKDSPAGVLVPRKFDVLFGRGKNNREHTGNLRCSLLVEMHMEQYENASKYEKTMIAERIVSMVEESLGRFLKFEAKKGWVEVSREEAREKVSHFFRFQRSKMNSNGDNRGGKRDEKSLTDTQGQHAKRITPCASPELPTPESDNVRVVKRKSFNEVEEGGKEC